MKAANKVQTETIAGISTALGRGAISIVRLSGNKAIQIVSKIFKGNNLMLAKSHTIHYGHIYNPNNNEVIDEVLVSVYRAPRTYTKEDIVEINCHGGIFVTNQIFELIVLAGARVSEAGEFTKRAYLNGRIDLTKAEAVMDVIDAESKAALKLANKGLRGDIKKLIDQKRDELLEIIAMIAVNIDYPEYDDVEELTNERLKPQIINLKNELGDILSRASDAQKLKNGITTTIVGRPNVGKSSLLNALLREDKAIVTAIPGTTRDVIEGQLFVGGIILNLIDTAGIRKTSDEIEKIGVHRSQEKLKEAELILLILDGSERLNEVDLELLENVKKRNHLVIINKSDLKQVLNQKDFAQAITISTNNPKDIENLEKRIKEMVLDSDINDSNLTYISNTRQLSKIKESIASLDKALESIAENAYIDFVDLYIQSAWHSLGEIIGEVRNEDLLDELFSKFCLGK